MRYRNAWITIVLALGISGTTIFSTAAERGSGSGEAAQAAPPVKIIWTVTEGIKTPESAFIDAESNSIFVSLIDGGPMDRDGNGHIARLSRDGKPVNMRWVTGLNAPKGLRKHGGTLWVADLDEVIGITIASGRIASRVKVEGAKGLNDIATAPDGTVYASDTSGSKIYAIKDGKASVFAEGDNAEAPNGLLVDGNRLIVGSVRQSADPNSGPGRLFALDIKTKQKTLLSSQTIGAVDGIEIDGSGGYIISDFMAARVLQVSKSGQVTQLLQLEGTAADLAYDAGKKIVIVPHLRGDRVVAYDLSGLVK